MTEKIINKRQRFIFHSWVSILSGIFLFVLGLIRNIFGEVDIGRDIQYSQPLVFDGSIYVFVGILLFCIGIIRLIRKKKYLENDLYHIE